jgi:hypothetical protein
MRFILKYILSKKVDLNVKIVALYGIVIRENKTIKVHHEI